MDRHPVACVGAFVRDADGRLLLVKRGQPPSEGQWSVPGGRQEFGETARQAAAREVLEETGLEVEVGALAHQVDLIDNDVHYAIVDFHARLVGGHLEAGDDATEAAWFTDDEALRLDLVASVRAWLTGSPQSAPPGPAT